MLHGTLREMIQGPQAPSMLCATLKMWPQVVTPKGERMIQDALSGAPGEVTGSCYTAEPTQELTQAYSYVYL